MKLYCLNCEQPHEIYAAEWPFLLYYYQLLNSYLDFPSGHCLLKVLADAKHDKEVREYVEQYHT